MCNVSSAKKLTATYQYSCDTSPLFFYVLRNEIPRSQRPSEMRYAISLCPSTDHTMVMRSKRRKLLVNTKISPGNYRDFCEQYFTRCISWKFFAVRTRRHVSRRIEFFYKPLFHTNTHTHIYTLYKHILLYILIIITMTIPAPLRILKYVLNCGLRNYECIFAFVYWLSFFPHNPRDRIIPEFNPFREKEGRESALRCGYCAHDIRTTIELPIKVRRQDSRLRTPRRSNHFLNALATSALESTDRLWRIHQLYTCVTVNQNWVWAFSSSTINGDRPWTWQFTFVSFDIPAKSDSIFGSLV